MAQDAKERLFSRVIKNGECLEHQGRDITGTRTKYSRVRYKTKKILAHRLAYMLCKGEIPSGMLVLHKCDNSKCINPEHLFLGTQKDNVEDARAKNRYNPFGWKKI